MHLSVFLAIFALNTPVEPVALDPNNDGRVTAAEYKISRRTFLFQADIDGSGRLSEHEWKLGAPMLRQQAKEGGLKRWDLIGREDVFAILDLDGDGVLTPVEIDEVADQRFQHLDRNHDGFVTREEVGGKAGRQLRP